MKKFQSGGITNAQKVANNKKKVEANKKAVTNAKTNAELKKLENQGKPNSSNKTLYKGVSYNKKGAIASKYDVGSKKGDRSFYSSGLGEPNRTTYNPSTGKVTYERIDTTGFSSGKKNFTKETTTQAKSKGPLSKSSKTVNRKDIPKELKKMQTFKKAYGGVIKSKKK